MPNLIVPNITSFQTQKQLAAINNIQVLLKGVLINSCAHNFVHMKTSVELIKRYYHELLGKVKEDERKNLDD